MSIGVVRATANRDFHCKESVGSLQRKWVRLGSNPRLWSSTTPHMLDHSATTGKRITIYWCEELASLNIFRHWHLDGKWSEPFPIGTRLFFRPVFFVSFVAKKVFVTHNFSLPRKSGFGWIWTHDFGLRRRHMWGLHHSATLVKG